MALAQRTTIAKCAAAQRRAAAPRVAFGSPIVAQLKQNAKAVAAAQQPAAQRSVKAQAAAVGTAPAQASTYNKSQFELYTFTTWLLQEERKGNIDSELATVLSSISLACKQIAAAVGRSGISSLTGVAGTGENVQGEEQKKLDVISNDIFCNCLRMSGRTGVIASEEEATPVAVEETTSGNYIVVFDPLDGSSNIDAGISVGSIFGIYEPSESCMIDDGSLDQSLEACITNVCQPGKNLLAAGYCLYSSCHTLVLTIGDGVYGFTLDPYVGEFVLTHNRIQVPEVGKIYSFNEGNYALWDEPTKKYMDSLKDPSKWGGKPYSARYIGSLVGDFHRTMLYGGIYGYPGDAKNKNGKLRLLYECAPMSFIAEQAGGAGSTGTQRVLDIEPTEVHQRVPLMVGSKKEVEYFESFYKNN